MMRKVLLIFDKYCSGNDQLDIGIGDYVFIQSIKKIKDIQAFVFYLYAKDVNNPDSLTHRIQDAIVNFSPDLVVMSPHFVGKPIACIPERQVFRKLCEGIPSVFISYDTGNDEIIHVLDENQEPVSWVNYWDGYADIIVHTDCYYPVHQKFIGDHTLSHHVCAFTPFDLDLGRCDPSQPRDIDYAFMGSVYRYRYPFVQALQSLPFKRFIGDGPATGRQLLYQEYLNILKRSKISINFSKGWHGNSEQIKVRIWEILACNSVLFEQDSRESRRILEKYNCAVFFNDPEDLSKKISYYLEHPNLLPGKKLASQAFLKDYNYERFWQIVFNAVDDLGKPLRSRISFNANSQIKYATWINTLNTNSLSILGQSPASLQSLIAWAKQYAPTKIIDLGTGPGLSLRVWLTLESKAKIISIDRDFQLLEQAQSALPLDLSQVELRCQDALVTDFSSLWSSGDRVLFYVDVADRPGMPIMQYLLATAIPYLPTDSVVVVDDLWYSPVAISSQTLNKFWQARIAQDINLSVPYDMFAMPYWQSGSVVGSSEVIALMAWVNTHQLAIYCHPGLKGIAIPVSNPPVPTTSTAPIAPQPIAHLSYSPVSNFRIREADQVHPNLKQVMIICQVGAQLYTIRQYQAALQQFKQAATLLPQVGNLYYAQALCLLQQGDFLAASQALQQELQFQPVSPEAKRLARKLAILSPHLA